MKQYIHTFQYKRALLCILAAGLLFTLSCSKENTLEPSYQDSNYFVNKDNPNDPIDHAIYKFYERTGIASFYTDTIHKKLVSKQGELPERYSYVTLSLNYHPLGDKSLVVTSLSSKEKLPALLELIEKEVVPHLPSATIIPCLLFIDGYRVDWEYSNIQLSHGLTAIFGFNAVGIVVKDVEAMNEEEKKKYAASILAGIAERRINNTDASNLAENFYSVSRSIMQNSIPYDVYSGYPLFILLPPSDIPIPESIGLLYYPVIFFGMDAESLPTETTDLRSYLTAVFSYTDQEFSDLHTNHPLLIKKFAIVRDLVQKSGFKLLD